MGKWVTVAERNPAEYGKYRILRRAGTRYRSEDVYLWNGSYWVTRGGSPTKSVECWWESDGSAPEPIAAELKAVLDDLLEETQTRNSGQEGQECTED